MTRKQALTQAIEVLKLSEENKEAVRILEELRGELPIIHWTDSSIRDTVEQYIVDNGKVPTPTAFKNGGMPPHPVIKNKYGITVSEWIEAVYGPQKPSQAELRIKYTDEFVKTYHRIKPKSGDEYNANRANAKGWQTVAKYHEVKTWRALLKKLELTPYFDMKKDHQPVKFKVQFHLDTDFTD